MSKVVLPDPFEPIRPWIWPRLTVRSTLSTAVTPPKARRAPSTTSAPESPAPITGGHAGSCLAGLAVSPAPGPDPLTGAAGAATGAATAAAGSTSAASRPPGTPSPRGGLIPSRSPSTLSLASSPFGRKIANRSSSTPKTMPLYCCSEVKNWLIPRMIAPPISGPVIDPPPPITMPARSSTAKLTDELPGAKNCCV